ncbi:hypothetical protein LSAT2_010335 [Lamellibrachia satsuma]|nr:hypothetical protein LSAT2_010335 [Lamellibrachia satsuma]
METNDPCRKKACAIGRCMTAQGFRKGACENAVAALLACCRKCGSRSLVCSNVTKESLEEFTATGSTRHS